MSLTNFTLPDTSVVTVNSPAVSGAAGARIDENDANLANNINNISTHYLPLTGGTITGTINTQNIICQAVVKTDTIQGGSGPVVVFDSAIDATGFTVTASSFSGSGTSLTGILKSANNLSDVTASTARTNLGLGTMATQASTDYLLLSGGTLVNTSTAAPIFVINQGTPSVLPASGTVFMSIASGTCHFMDVGYNSGFCTLACSGIGNNGFWFQNSLLFNNFSGFVNANAGGGLVLSNGDVVFQAPNGSTYGTVGGSGYVATSGSKSAFSVTPVYQQSGTTANTDFLINRSGTVGSGTQLLIDAKVAGTSKFKVDTSATLYLGGGSIATPSDIFFPGSGGVTAIDVSAMYYPDGSLFMDTGGCYYLGNSTVFDTDTIYDAAEHAVIQSGIILYPDGSGVALATAKGLQLKSFATGSYPASPSEGSAIWDSTAKAMKVYNGTAWKTVTLT